MVPMVMNNEPARKTFDLELPENLKHAISLLANAGGKGHLVGGSVRDALLNLRPKDFDVEVYGLTMEKIAEVLGSLGDTVTTGKAFSVIELRVDEQEYDFSVPRKEHKTGSGHRGFEIVPDPNLSEFEASLRRDLTINALHYDPICAEVIDFHGGLSDLENGILRHVSNAFREDPLRPLRLMQFAGRFGFELHPDTAAICSSLKDEYCTLPAERVWGEWEKWANKSVQPSFGLKALKDMDWLDIYPEIESLNGVPQDPEWHPEGDVWEHTLHCVDAIVNLDEWKQSDAENRCILLLATLCHDFGKVECTQQIEKGGRLRWTSHGHSEAGIPISKRFLKRIGAFKNVADPVPLLVHKHHFLMSPDGKEPTNASLRRLARKLNPANAVQLAAVMKADALGRPPLPNKKKIRDIDTFIQRMGKLDIAVSRPVPILMGRHLIDLGLEPGPAFKSLLDVAFEAQLDGAFDSVESGIQWLSGKGYL